MSMPRPISPYFTTAEAAEYLGAHLRLPTDLPVELLVSARRRLDVQLESFLGDLAPGSTQDVSAIPPRAASLPELKAAGA